VTNRSPRRVWATKDNSGTDKPGSKPDDTQRDKESPGRAGAFKEMSMKKHLGITVP